MLTVLTPAASSRLVTLAAVKAALGVTGTGEDSALGDLIDRASSVIAGHCQRVLGVETLSETFRVPCTNLTRPLSLARPRVTVASVTADGSSLTVDTDYETDSPAGLLWRLSSGVRTAWYDCNVAVVYSAGWILPGDVGANLPAAITEQCLGLVTSAYTRQGRDPAVQRDTQEGVGSVQYFDRPGSGAMQVDDAMRAALEPFKVGRR